MYVDRDVDDCVWWKSLHEVVWLARVHKEGIRDMVASVSNGHEAAKARRALFSGLLGTTLEWYEFFCFGIASALVFGRLFFPSEDPLVGTMLALSTFSVAFIVRPIGAVVCGYLGDKFGRKNILVITLITMGVATFGIGILPTYQQVGILAPVLLIVLRVFQGLSLGGEFSGTVLMSVEHAKPERKGFFGALMNVGIPVGLFLANGIFFLVSLADDGFLMTWGWRIPFLVSVILVGVGFYIRMGVTESPEFSELKESAEVVENPSKEAFRFHWKRILLVAFTYFGCGVAFYASNTFVITYLETFVGVNESLILSTMMIGFAFLAVSIVFFGWLSDKINRRLLLASSFALFIPASFLFFHLIEYGTRGMMLLGFVVFFIPQGVNLALIPTVFSETFPGNVRYTGMASGYTLGTILGSAPTPVLLIMLATNTSGSWAIAGYIAAACLLSMLTGLTLRPASEIPARNAAPRISG